MPPLIVFSPEQIEIFRERSRIEKKRDFFDSRCTCSPGEHFSILDVLPECITVNIDHSKIRVQKYMFSTVLYRNSLVFVVFSKTWKITCFTGTSTNASKLSPSCPKLARKYIFSVFGARAPPESDFHFQGLCIMPLQGRDSSRKNTFKPIDSEHFCVRIQSSFPVWVKNYKLSILCKLLEKDFAKTENQAGLKASCSSVLSFLCEKSFSNAPLPSVS